MESTPHSRAPEISVTYMISHANPEKIAGEIALEQTVEMPRAAVSNEQILSEITGRVISIEKHEGSGCIANISYPASVSNFEIPQFLNLLYGNISFKPGIRIVGLDLPEEFLLAFRGPRFGIEGIRKLLGVFNRPLVSTALKPMGSTAEDLAHMCYRFALGGIDIIKDDHGLADFPFCPFRDRVAACMHAINRAQRETGKKTLYFPNITGRFEKILDDVDFAVSEGVGGILISPFLVGFDCVRHIAENETIGKPVMSHPAFCGSLFSGAGTGIAPEIVLGTLFRLIGIDSSVYPNYGGRFSFTKETCSLIAASLRGHLGHMRPALPTPAGGIDLKNIADVVHFYGNDIILLIGGSLYERPGALEDSARFFCDKVTEASKNRRYTTTESES